jgi:hypothetical protein
MPSVNVYSWVPVLFAVGAVVAFVSYFISKRRWLFWAAIFLILAAAAIWYLPNVYSLK